MAASTSTTIDDHERAKLVACRMYRREFPEVEELVMVEITRVTETGVYAKLLEYNNIEGMMILSEVSKRRFRSIHKLVRVGRQEIVMVLRVDSEKGYVDLSKKRVAPEDRESCEDQWNKAKTVHSILQYVCQRTLVPLIEVYERFGWDLYDKYPHALDGFKALVADSDEFFQKFDVPENLKKELVTIIERRLAAQSVKLRAVIEITCFTYEGIEAIKKALRTGLELSTEQIPIQIYLIAPPRYCITTTVFDKESGIERVDAVCERIKKEIESLGGIFTLKDRAHIDRSDGPVGGEDDEGSGDEEEED